MLRIDHVIYAVGDLDAAGARFEQELGLRSVPGGSHPAFGTANRIVPLGDCYLELMGVVDDSLPLGAFVRAQTAGGDRWLGWCVRTDDPETLAARIGADVIAGERLKPDGTRLSWRTAGLPGADATPGAPFFIAWDDPAVHPGRDPIEHPSGAHGIEWMEVATDERALREVLGGATLPVRVVDGEPGVRAVAVATEGPPIVIRV